MPEVETIDLEMPRSWEHYMMTCDGDRYSEREWLKIEKFLYTNDIVYGVEVLSRTDETVMIRCQRA